MSDQIYLDYAATGPLDPDVARVMLPWLQGTFGNPSALHARGRAAAAVLEAARGEVAGVLGARSREIVFTSGGSESINAALRGIALAQRQARFGAHVVVSAIEHQAVLHTCQYLETFGFEISYVGVDASGMIDPAEVVAALRPDTVLVSIMHTNNEVGTVQPIAAIAEGIRRRQQDLGRSIPFHTDAVQSPLWLSVDVAELGVDSLSLSAHKFGGPLGAGVLYLRRGVPFVAQLTGGGQERQRRAGTENVAAIAGTARALTLAAERRERRFATASRLKRALAAGILAHVPDAIEHAVGAPTVPAILSISFPGAQGDSLVEALDRAGVAVSSGAACASQSWEPSHVLLAMGMPLETAAAGVRFSLGSETTAAEIDEAVRRIPAAVAEVRPVEVT